MDIQLVPGELLALCASSFISAAVSALSGFGLAIIFHVAVQILSLVGVLQLPLADVVVLICILGPFTNWPLLFVSRMHVMWRLFAILWPTQAIFMFIGLWLLVSVKNDTLKTALGVVLLLFALWKVIDELRQYLKRRHTVVAQSPSSNPPEKDQTFCVKNNRLKLSQDSSIDYVECQEKGEVQPLLTKNIIKQDEEQNTFRWTTWTLALAFICGCLSGLLGGLFAVSGPPLMVFVTLIQLDKEPLYSLPSPVVVVPVSQTLQLFLSFSGVQACNGASSLLVHINSPTVLSVLSGPHPNIQQVATLCSCDFWRVCGDLCGQPALQVLQYHPNTSWHPFLADMFGIADVGATKLCGAHCLWRSIFIRRWLWPLAFVQLPLFLRKKMFPYMVDLPEQADQRFEV